MNTTTVRSLLNTPYTPRGMEADEVMSQEETKAAMKEALKEWMDEKFAIFGRWSFYSIGAMALTALVYFMLRMDGWKH